MGRPTKLNKDLIRDALAAAQMGMTIDLLSDYIGVNRSTVYDWIRRGSEEPGSIYRDFADAVSRGRSQCAALNLHRIQQASAEDWRAAAWLLCHRWPDRWSEKRVVEVSTGNKPDGAAMVASMLAQLREDHAGHERREEQY